MRLRIVVVVVLGALTLAGCVSLPQGGGVRSGANQEQGEQSIAPFDYTPDGPRPGAAPVDVVGGYLLAMQATPLTTAVARTFLTEKASTRWVPEKSTVVYASQSLEGTGRSVRMDLADTVELDRRGEWLGDTTGGRGIRHVLRLVRERGEWRISDPPDALIVPQSHFETRFAQYFLYFFDKSAQILVPEPVYLPRGEQTPTLLVRGLLEGPAPNLVGATRTFVPAGTELDDLSVLVSGSGMAEVPLSDEILELDAESLNFVLGQLSWTLRQIPGVETMQITVDGSPLDTAGEGVDQDVRGWPEFDPSVNWASEELFGVRDGAVVAVTGDRERRIAGLFDTDAPAPRSIAVDLPATQVAGVSEDGADVVVAPRLGEVGRVAKSANANEIYTGATNLLPPAWDIYGQVWLVDRRPGGATLTVVRSGVSTELVAPGISGERVRAFLVSRDGTRLVVALADRSGDRLVVARVMRDEEGKVRRLSRVTRLPVDALNVDEIRDLGWLTPGSVALLTDLATGRGIGQGNSRSQVVVTLIDGSSGVGDVATNAEIFRDEAFRVVTSPTPGAPVYLGTLDGQLFELAADGGWTEASIAPGLASPTFVG